jgi:hypothetical protein
MRLRRILTPQGVRCPSVSASGFTIRQTRIHVMTAIALFSKAGSRREPLPKKKEGQEVKCTGCAEGPALAGTLCLVCHRDLRLERERAERRWVIARKLARLEAESQNDSR